MTRFVPQWTAFNAGELSPLFDGRTDQDKYYVGCKTLRNMIPTLQGPAMRRGGSRFVGYTKNNGKVWLRPFEFSAEQSYVLEFGHQYIRFWVDRGQLLSGMTPYEIASPWTLAQLTSVDGGSTLRTVQSGDIMWITLVDGSSPPYRLQRMGATNWTLTQETFLRGPFEDINLTSTTTVQASATTGTGITLTASAGLFSPGLVGTSIFLESTDPARSPAWQPARSYAADAIVHYDGNVYQTTAGGTSGSYALVHKRGTSSDGGVSWTYLHSGWGIARITAYTSPTSVTADVVSTLPAEVTSGGLNGLTSTTRWAFASFSAVQGWPTCVAFFRDRLVYAKGRTLYMSVVGDYADFSKFDGPEITEETAVQLTVATDRVDNFRWIAPSRDLLCGTSRSELSIGEQTDQRVFSASNAQNTPQTEYGSRLIPPLRAGEAVLFVQRAGRKLRELKYSYEIDRYRAEDLTVLSDHILGPGLIDMDFALEEDATLWAVLKNGQMAALTYDRDRGVLGWTSQLLGGQSDTTAWGAAESVAVIPKPDNTRDDPWVAVRREINGSVVRCMEILEGPRLVESSGQSDGFYVDCGLTYEGAPTSVITGLNHLEGEEVQVCVDGSAHENRVVQSGQISLIRNGSTVHVGYGYPSILQTMRAEGGVNDGSGQTRRRSIAELFIRLHNTVGGSVGPSLDRLDALPFLDPSLPVGTAAPLFTGDKRVAFPAQYDTDGYVYVVQDQCLPMTVVSMTARMDVND